MINLNIFKPNFKPKSSWNFILNKRHWPRRHFTTTTKLSWHLCGRVTSSVLVRGTVWWHLRAITIIHSCYFHQKIHFQVASDWAIWKAANIAAAATFICISKSLIFLGKINAWQSIHLTIRPDCPFLQFLSYRWPIKNQYGGARSGNVHLHVSSLAAERKTSVHLVRLLSVHHL